MFKTHESGASSARWTRWPLLRRMAATFLPARRRAPLLTASAELRALFPQLPVYALPRLAQPPAGPQALAGYAALGAGAELHQAYVGAMQALGAHTATGQVWLVASAHPGAGGACTAAALAGLCAAHARRVVLVDADLRRRHLYAAFGASPQPGLAEVLQHDAAWPQALTPLAAQGFLLLPAGAAPLEPGALAQPALSAMLAATLAELRGYYDLVLVSLPAPALAATGLSAQADRTLVVMQQGHTPLAACTEPLGAAHAEAHATCAVVVEGMAL